MMHFPKYISPVKRYVHAHCFLSHSEKFSKVFNEQQAERRRLERERHALFSADPFDPEVQKRIAEEIR